MAGLAGAPGGSLAETVGPPSSLALVPLPVQVVGAWRLASSLDRDCPETGPCTPGIGSSAALVIASDGAAEYSRFDSTPAAGCGPIQVLVRKVGRVSLSGTKLVFAPHEGTYRATNGCRPELNGSWRLEASDLMAMTLAWEIVTDPTDPAKTALGLVDLNGRMSGVYSRR
jgi:hypothetical protein